MISLHFFGGGGGGGRNNVAPSSNTLKVHSFSNIPLLLWKTGTNREAGPGQTMLRAILKADVPPSPSSCQGGGWTLTSHINTSPFYIYWVQFNCNCSHFTANKEKYWIKSAQFPINGTRWLVTLHSALGFTLTEFYLTDTQNKCGFFFHSIKQSSASH